MLDQTKAQAVERFFGLLHHTKGKFAGQPFILQPWQRDIVLPLLCEVDDATGLRRYRQGAWFLPRKNGKSSIAAGLALWFLCADGEASPEVYGAATSRDQAKIVFDQAKAFVEGSPILSKQLRVYRNAIELKNGNGVYKPISADVRRQHGFNASAIVYDELHSALDRDLFDVLQTSTGAREQPIMLSISTAGKNLQSIAYEQWEYARQVNAGIIEDRTFQGVIFAANAADNWTSLDTWRRANPNLGISISEEYAQQMIDKGKNDPSFVPTLKQLHLNIWTQSESKWLEAGAWASCKVENFDDLLVGAPCFLGLDMSQQHDLTAAVLCWHIEGKYYVKPFFWVPEDIVQQREHKDKVPYRTWIQQGLVKTTPGNVIDHATIIKDIVALAEQYHIQRIGYDRWGAVQVSSALNDAGLTCVPVGQGFATFAAPTSELTRLISSKGIAHDGNAVLAWNMDNVILEKDSAGNQKPSKKKSRDKIDGAVGLLMALDQAMRNKPVQSVYQERGILTL